MSRPSSVLLLCPSAFGEQGLTARRKNLHSLKILLMKYLQNTTWSNTLEGVISLRLLHDKIPQHHIKMFSLNIPV